MMIPAATAPLGSTSLSGGADCKAGISRPRSPSPDDYRIRPVGVAGTLREDHLGEPLVDEPVEAEGAVAREAGRQGRRDGRTARIRGRQGSVVLPHDDVRDIHHVLKATGLVPAVQAPEHVVPDGR